MKPIDANTLDKVCKMKRDHLDYRGYWILTDGYHVSIHKQKVGEPSTQKVMMPKHVFDRLARWYVTGSVKK